VFLAAVIAFAPSASWAAIRVLGEAELVDPQPDPKQPDKPLSPYKNIVVRVKADASGLRLSSFLLKTTDVEPNVTVPALKMNDFHESTEPMALVIIVDGKERFMGNPTPVSDTPGEAPIAIPGGYPQAKEAIDSLAKSRTKNTKVALWVAAEKVIEK